MTKREREREKWSEELRKRNESKVIETEIVLA